MVIPMSGTGALGAKEIFEKLGAVMDVKRISPLFHCIERAMGSRAAFVESGVHGELPEIILCPYTC